MENFQPPHSFKVKKDSTKQVLQWLQDHVTPSKTPRLLKQIESIQDISLQKISLNQSNISKNQTYSDLSNFEKSHDSTNALILQGVGKKSPIPKREKYPENEQVKYKRVRRRSYELKESNVSKSKREKLDLLMNESDNSNVPTNVTYAETSANFDKSLSQDFKDKKSYKFKRKSVKLDINPFIENFNEGNRTESSINVSPKHNQTANMTYAESSSDIDYSNLQSNFKKTFKRKSVKLNVNSIIGKINDDIRSESTKDSLTQNNDDLNNLTSNLTYAETSPNINKSISYERKTFKPKRKSVMLDFNSILGNFSGNNSSELNNSKTSSKNLLPNKSLRSLSSPKKLFYIDSMDDAAHVNSSDSAGDINSPDTTAVRYSPGGAADRNSPKLAKSMNISSRSHEAVIDDSPSKNLRSATKAVFIEEQHSSYDKKSTKNLEERNFSYNKMELSPNLNRENLIQNEEQGDNISMPDNEDDYVSETHSEKSLDDITDSHTLPTVYTSYTKGKNSELSSKSNSDAHNTKSTSPQETNNESISSNSKHRLSPRNKTRSIIRNKSISPQNISSRRDISKNKSHQNGESLSTKKTELKQLTMKEFLHRLAKGNMPSTHHKDKPLTKLINEYAQKNAARNTTAQVKTKHSQKKKDLPIRSINITTNKKIFQHFCRNKVTKDAMEIVQQTTEKFFSNFIQDISVITTVAKVDKISHKHIYLLMKQLKLINSEIELHALMQELLPASEWIKAVPIMYPYNNVQPD